MKALDIRKKVLGEEHPKYANSLINIGVTYSSDNGETWSKLQLIDTPNNNSGIDAVTLQDGTFAMICNDWPIEPTKEKGARTPLSILRSTDGIHWNHWITLEDSPILQYSYPAIIQGRDGTLHCVYTWRRQRIAYKQLSCISIHDLHEYPLKK